MPDKILLWDENIAYGKMTAACAIILALIIDDGRLARTHRKGIFDPSINYGRRSVRAARALWQRLHYQFCQAATPNGPPGRFTGRIFSYSR